MRRQSGRVSISLVVVAIVIAVGAYLVVKETSGPSGPVFIYGDSNVGLAEPFLDKGATVRWLGDSGPCNFFTKMQADALLKPSVVVLAFTGGIFSPCAHTPSRHDAYLRDYLKARALFPPDTKVYVVLPPPTRSPAEKFLGTPSNRDVYQAAQESGLPTLDAWDELGGASAPYAVVDGIHLNEKGQRIYASVLSQAY